MNLEDCRPVPFKFQLGDLTLFSLSIKLQMRANRLIDQNSPMDSPMPPNEKLMGDCQGFAIRGLPISKKISIISRTNNYLRYVPLQYQHSYIDLGKSFEEYKEKFSAKTRSTINRKVKKYAEHCSGSIIFKTYKTPGDMQEFFKYARMVSMKSYQDKLLNAGIPNNKDFMDQAQVLASVNCLRAYILFDGERPVSYLYCPVFDGVLIYDYLGYDPDYKQMSVGTVLQWLALEQLFEEGIFKYFDFTEGQADHKRLFATHQRLCANVFFVERTFRNKIIIYSHFLMLNFTDWAGEILNRLGFKTLIKRIIRSA